MLSFAAFQTADNDGYDMNRSDLSAWGGKPENFVVGLTAYAVRVRFNGAAGRRKHDSTHEAQTT